MTAGGVPVPVPRPGAENGRAGYACSTRWPDAGSLTIALEALAGANACDANDVNYKLKITLSNINATGGTALTFADYEYSIDLIQNSQF